VTSNLTKPDAAVPLWTSITWNVLPPADVSVISPKNPCDALIVVPLIDALASLPIASSPIIVEASLPCVILVPLLNVPIPEKVPSNRLAVIVCPTVTLSNWLVPYA